MLGCDAGLSSSEAHLETCIPGPSLHPTPLVLGCLHAASPPSTSSDPQVPPLPSHLSGDCRPAPGMQLCKAQWKSSCSPLQMSCGGTKVSHVTELHQTKNPTASSARSQPKRQQSSEREQPPRVLVHPVFLPTGDCSVQPHRASYLPSHTGDGKEVADRLFPAQLSKLFPSHPLLKPLERLQRAGQAV